MNPEALLNIVKCKLKSALPDMLKSHKLTFSFFGPVCRRTSSQLSVDQLAQ